MFEEPIRGGLFADNDIYYKLVEDYLVNITNNIAIITAALADFPTPALPFNVV